MTNWVDQDLPGSPQAEVAEQGPGHLGPAVLSGLPVEEVQDGELGGEHVEVGLPLEEGDRGDGGAPRHRVGLRHVPEGAQVGDGGEDVARGAGEHYRFTSVQIFLPPPQVEKDPKQRY